MSFRDMSKKSLPECLRLDLRRKGLWVPPEIQMKIMYFKEIAETRELKDWTMREIATASVCHYFEFTHFCGDNDWKSSHRRVNNLRATNDTNCHWCGKFYRELLGIGMRAQLARPVPNLDLLDDECSWLVAELYQHRAGNEPQGQRLRNVKRRNPAIIDSVDALMQWTSSSAAVVDVMTNLRLILQAQGQWMQPPPAENMNQ